VTLRVAGRLRHIGVGRTYARTDVILLVQDLHVTVINAATSVILRDLTIDPRRDYQPTTRTQPQKQIVRTCTSQVRTIPMSRDITVRAPGRIRTCATASGERFTRTA
jgi:hypothetical protein